MYILQEVVHILASGESLLYESYYQQRINTHYIEIIQMQ